MNARLDVLSERGQLSVSQEAELLRAIEVNFAATLLTCIPTPKDAPARVDGVMMKNRCISGVFESKCRQMTRRQLREWGDEWLITFDKLIEGAATARLLGVPLFGFLYLVPDRLGLAIRIADHTGSFIVPMRLERTETQATINGGKIVRTNAYVSMGRAHEFPIPS